MIQAYKDGALFYDSRLQRDDMRLLHLAGDYELNKGGVVEFTMTSSHRDFDTFVSHKTIVEIWKDGKLEFRGRALYPSDDFLHRRTITCEGERCFLRDAVMRPYLYQTEPAAIFTAIIETYNAQVEPEKQFAVGEVTVTDPNHYIALKSESAEQVLDAIDRLVERCGGYITFTTNAEGKRAINWYASISGATNQKVEFGENLLDFSRSDDNPELITAVLPYGAEDEETQERLTLAGVNGGVDYIVDEDARALRGFICRPVYFDDITDVNNLRTAAKLYLAEQKLVVTTLELSAVDLSNIDKDIDAFKEGDLIRVISKPHGVDDYYLLTNRRPDYLNPGKNTIVLGKSTASLTGNTTSGQKHQANIITQLQGTVKGNSKQQAEALAATERNLLSQISQTANGIFMQVSEEYATPEQVQSAVATSYEQTKQEFNFSFETLETKVNANGEQLERQEKYIRFKDGKILLGEEGNELTLEISNDRISFLQNGGEVAYFSNNKLYVKDGEYTNSLQLGNFAFLPRNNGNLSFKKVN